VPGVSLATKIQWTCHESASLTGSFSYIIFEMSIYRRRFQALVTAFWIAFLVAIWINFAPVQAGGQASYVIVAGQSMEPDMHLGDLVIVHKTIGYQVGDVVAYQNADIDRYVIHRIFDLKRGRYRLKGDNNSWIDGYEPTGHEVLGKLWIHLPRLGIYIQKLREPIFMALFAGLIGSMVAGTLFVSKQREKNLMKENSNKTELNTRKWLTTWFQNISFRKIIEKFASKRSGGFAPPPGEQSPDKNNSQRKNMIETIFFTLAIVAFLSLMLGILSITRPATQTVSDDVDYQQLGFFSYSAAAPAGVYDSTTIRSGEPIFPALTCSVNITFNYTLVASSAENIAGSYQMTAFLTHPQSGWQRTLPLQERSPFSGLAFNTQTELNLCEIVRLVESVEAITDARQGTYLLSISPQAQITGLIEGRSLETEFEPSLSFQYDRTQFYLVSQGEDAAPLNSNEMNFLHAEKQIPNTLSLFGIELKVPALRTIAVIGLVLSLSGLAFLGFQLERILRTDRHTFVRMKYDPLIIDVEDSGLRKTNQIIKVSSIDDLARLAEKHNAMILHEVQDEVDNYLVHLNEFSYIFSQKEQEK
jgi:signal peptidase I